MRSGSEGPNEETMRVLAGLPKAEDWPDIDDAERQRRERVLWDVTLRVMEDGPRKAKPSPERGRQFMPFAALRGYDEMIAEVERRSSAPEDGCGGREDDGPTRDVGEPCDEDGGDSAAHDDSGAEPDVASPHMATS